MRRGFSVLLIVVALALSHGCSGGPNRSGAGRPPGAGDLEKLKANMTTLFSALEMYAHDHNLSYPDTTDPLIPKYLDSIPADPFFASPLDYQKTERGYIISSSADYRDAGAEKGFPQMDQDGFFALKSSDFPSTEVPGEEPSSGPVEAEAP